MSQVSSSPAPDRSATDTVERRTFVSVIVPVTERPRALDWVYREFSGALKEAGIRFEFVFAIEPWGGGMVDALRPLVDAGEPIRVVDLGQSVGESFLLDAAGSYARAPVLVTLPAYPRVVPEALVELVRAVEAGADLATAVRIDRDDSALNRAQKRLFHLLLRGTVGGDFRDIASGVRAMRKEVLEEVPLYGDFFRFLPLLARKGGFRVEEVPVEQHPDDRGTRIYGPGVYLRRLVDVLGLMFLTRFTYKPLRFFGLVGATLSLGGAVILLVLFVQRLAGQGIADRPLLLLGVLLLVLGIQAVAMGLIGEIIVHLSASHRRLYRLRPEPSEPGLEPGQSDG